MLRVSRLARASLAAGNTTSLLSAVRTETSRLHRSTIHHSAPSSVTVLAERRPNLERPQMASIIPDSTDEATSSRIPRVLIAARSSPGSIGANGADSNSSPSYLTRGESPPRARQSSSRARWCFLPPAEA
jgi:hypothetical protein